MPDVAQGSFCSSYVLFEKNVTTSSTSLNDSFNDAESAECGWRPDLKSFVALFLGGIVGTLIFLVVATLFFGDPFGDWFMSAHGIFAADRQKELTEADNVQIYRLLSRGLIVSSDSIISNMTDLYGNMIQVLIGVMAVATFFAFFAVRWQSIQSAEDYVDSKSNEHFSSNDFKSLVKSSVRDYVDTLDPNTNPQVANAPVVAQLSDEITELQDRMILLEKRISGLASAEESDGQELAPVARPKRRSSRRSS